MTLKQLNKNDRVSIIGFNNKAYKMCGFISVNYVGKLKLNKVINDLIGHNEANISEGIILALNTLKNRAIPNENSALVLFSLTNSGNLQRIKLYLEDFKDFKFAFHCIGLGPDHNSRLLNFLSSSGTYTCATLDTLYEMYSKLIISFTTGRIFDIDAKLMVSSAIPAQISKIFKYPRSIQLGTKLNIVFLVIIKPFSKEIRDTLQIWAKVHYNNTTLQFKN